MVAHTGVGVNDSFLIITRTETEQPYRKVLSDTSGVVFHTTISLVLTQVMHLQVHFLTFPLFPRDHFSNDLLSPCVPFFFFYNSFTSVSFFFLMILFTCSFFFTQLLNFHVSVLHVSFVSTCSLSRRFSPPSYMLTFKMIHSSSSSSSRFHVSRLLYFHVSVFHDSLNHAVYIFHDSFSFLFHKSPLPFPHRNSSHPGYGV